MFLALVLVPLVVLFDSGGYANISTIIANTNPGHLNIFAGTTVLGIISSLAWGLGYFGQPHIIVRFMAIRSIKDIKVARRIGMSWMIVALTGAMATGFFGFAYTEKSGITVNDAETIFIVLAQVLFHPVIAGFLLAAILAAIMSTISSQLLVTSSSLTEDVYKIFINKKASDKQLVFMSRICVILVAMIAIALAHNRDSTILNIVANAWAGFGAAFGPLIVLGLYWKRMTFAGALAGIVVGAVTILIWVYSPLTIGGQSLSSVVYEIVPGVIFGSIAIVVVSLADPEPSHSIRQMFDAMLVKVKEQQ